MDPETQPQGAVDGSGDTITAAEPTIEDRFAALVADDKQEETAQPEETEAAEETGDTPPEEETEGEEAELPPIPPPASWTAEEKERFSELPRDLQETLTRRESEREKFLQSKSQEAKQAELKASQQALALLQQTQADYVRSLQMLLPEVPERPSHLLQVSDPYAYAQAMEAHDTALTVRNYIAQELQQSGIQAQQQQDAIKQQAALLGQELLQEKFPEYLDTEKGPELRKQLQSTALALGYTAEQLAQTDAQDVLAMKQVSEWKAKAEKFDTLMAKQMQHVRDGKKVPAISRPGAPLGKGVADSQQYARDREAMRHGDRDAAARAIGRVLNQ